MKPHWIDEFGNFFAFNFENGMQISNAIFPAQHSLRNEVKRQKNKKKNCGRVYNYTMEWENT